MYFNLEPEQLTYLRTSPEYNAALYARLDARISNPLDAALLLDTSTPPVAQVCAWLTTACVLNLQQYYCVKFKLPWMHAVSPVQAPWCLICLSVLWLRLLHYMQQSLHNAILHRRPCTSIELDRIACWVTCCILAQLTQRPRCAAGHPQ